MLDRVPRDDLPADLDDPSAVPRNAGEEKKVMTLAQYAQFSNYAVASATGRPRLAFVAYVAQWVSPAMSRPIARWSAPEPTSRQRAGGCRAQRRRRRHRPVVDRSRVVVLLVGVVTRGLAAQRVPWGNMYEFGVTAISSRYGRTSCSSGCGGSTGSARSITGFGMVVLGRPRSSTCPPARSCRPCTRTGS